VYADSLRKSNSTYSTLLGSGPRTVGEGLVSDTRSVVADTLALLLYLLFENPKYPTDNH
jgi:hypothetical protein